MNSRAEKRLNRCKSSSLYLFVLCYRLFIIFLYRFHILHVVFFTFFFLLLFIWYFWFSSHSFLFFDQGSKSKCNFNHCAWEIVKIASKSVWLVTGKKSTWILVLRVVQIVFLAWHTWCEICVQYEIQIFQKSFELVWNCWDINNKPSKDFKISRMSVVPIRYSESSSNFLENRWRCHSKEHYFHLNANKMKWHEQKII